MASRRASPSAVFRRAATATCSRARAGIGTTRSDACCWRALPAHGAAMYRPVGHAAVSNVATLRRPRPIVLGRVWRARLGLSGRFAFRSRGHRLCADAGSPPSGIWPASACCDGWYRRPSTDFRAYFQSSLKDGHRLPAATPGGRGRLVCASTAIAAPSLITFVPSKRPRRCANPSCITRPARRSREGCGRRRLRMKAPSAREQARATSLSITRTRILL